MGVTILAAIGWVIAAVAVFFAVYTSRTLARVEAERVAMLERTRLALAEAEASVRRIREEEARSRPFAAEPVLRDLLDVVDNLDRAIAAGEGGQGVAMIHRQSLDLLRRHGAERIESVERDFDPAQHEAVATAPVAGPAHRVLQELAAGYRLHGRVLRAARVVVAVPVETPGEPSSNDVNTVATPEPREP